MKAVEARNCEGCVEYFVTASGKEGCSAFNRAILNSRQSPSLRNPVRFTGNKETCLDFLPNFMPDMSDKTKRPIFSLKSLAIRTELFIYSLSSALPPV